MCDHPNREAAMVVVERDADGVPTVWCDPCIEPLVRALNAGGVRTIASCCGHGKRDGSVVLADGRDLVITKFDVERYTQPAESRPREPLNRLTEREFQDLMDGYDTIRRQGWAEVHGQRITY